MRLGYPLSGVDGRLPKVLTLHPPIDPTVLHHLLNLTSANPCILFDPSSKTTYTHPCASSKTGWDRIHHAVLGAIRKVAKSHAALSVEERVKVYICTDFDVYLLHEPCLMCAMALLHSRVRRVFYIHKGSGVLGGKTHRLHTLPTVNHRFKVYHFKKEE